ncbi:MAG: exosortase/archaeosortase family protein [Phycisphaerae bacterium]
MTEPSPQSRAGRLTQLVVTSEPVRAAGLSRPAMAKIVVLAVLLAMMNYWQFPSLVASWMTDPNWSHGFIIPLFSLYLIYARRHEILAAPRRVCLAGLPIMIAGILGTLLGFYPIRTPWFSQLSMVVVIFGLVLYLAGPAVMRIAWLPIVYLALAMPIPDMLYSRIALPLQNFSAKSAAIFLQLCGVQISSSASGLDVTGFSGHVYNLTVAEACSGVRSLIAYVALGVAWAYLEYRPIWQRVVLVSATIPIAIFLNVVRVTITCFMNVIDRPEMGEDFMHSIMGMAMLVPAFLLLWLLNKLLQSMFVEVEDSPQADAAGDSKA